LDTEKVDFTRFVVVLPNLILNLSFFSLFHSRRRELFAGHEHLVYLLSIQGALLLSRIHHELCPQSRAVAMVVRTPVVHVPHDVDNLPRQVAAEGYMYETNAAVIESKCTHV
jgi:hypothetical protein